MSQNLVKSRADSVGTVLGQRKLGQQKLALDSIHAQLEFSSTHKPTIAYKKRWKTTRVQVLYNYGVWLVWTDIKVTALSSASMLLAF